MPHNPLIKDEYKYTHTHNRKFQLIQIDSAVSFFLEMNETTGAPNVSSAIVVDTDSNKE